MAGIVPDSPVDKYEIDIQKGDELIAVNGQKVDKDVNREKYFSGAVEMDEMKLTFKRGGNEYDVKVHPTTFSSIKTLEYKI